VLGPQLDGAGFVRRAGVGQNTFQKRLAEREPPGQRPRRVDIDRQGRGEVCR
jgi:hypothetical protein